METFQFQNAKTEFFTFGYKNNHQSSKNAATIKHGIGPMI